MSQNLIFILTEGDHDAAFIYRILKAHGTTTYHKIIKDYSAPLNDLFKSNIVNATVEDLNIEAARSRFLPFRVMQNGDNTFMIYAIGGDEQMDKRIKLLKVLNAFAVQDPNAISAISNTQIKVLYFLDADDKGKEARFKQVRVELEIALNLNNIATPLPNAEVVLIGDMHIGIFIFSIPGQDNGMLEDVLLPLMEQGNEDIFKAASEFLSIHETTSLFKGKLTMDGSTIKKVIKEKYTHRKSLIGTIGQLQTSGSSNTVCISRADYLDETKIKNDPTCNDIITFINKYTV